jgi:hypothetical protein
MATSSGSFSGRPAVTLYLDYSETSTNPGANTSVVSWTLRLVGNSASFGLDLVSTYSVNIGGTPYNGLWNYDFRSNNTPTIRSGTTTITHDADGSKTISVSASATDNAGSLGSASLSGSLALTTFPKGRRWNGSSWTFLTTRRRWTGSSWTPLTIAKRWNGTAWVDLS